MMDQPIGVPYSLQVVRALLVIVIVICLIEGKNINFIEHKIFLKKIKIEHNP